MAGVDYKLQPIAGFCAELHIVWRATHCRVLRRTPHRLEALHALGASGDGGAATCQVTAWHRVALRGATWHVATSGRGPPRGTGQPARQRGTLFGCLPMLPHVLGQLATCLGVTSCAKSRHIKVASYVAGSPALHWCHCKFKDVRTLRQHSADVHYIGVTWHVSCLPNHMHEQVQGCEDLDAAPRGRALHWCHLARCLPPETDAAHR